MDVLRARVGVTAEVSITRDLSILQEYSAQRRFSEFAVSLDHYHVNHDLFCCRSSRFRIKTVLGNVFFFVAQIGLIKTRYVFNEYTHAWVLLTCRRACFYQPTVRRQPEV